MKAIERPRPEQEMDRPLVAGLWPKRQSRERCFARVMRDTGKAKNGRLWKGANPKQVWGLSAYGSCVPHSRYVLRRLDDVEKSIATVGQNSSKTTSIEAVAIAEKSIKKKPLKRKRN